MANCGNLVQPKQIFKILACHVRANGFTTTVATSNTVTSDITTVLASAGAGATSVPLQVSTSESVIGVITTSPNNRVEIWDSSTRLKMQDGDGNEVYGRITESTGTYTLNYYSIVAGTQTAFTMDGRDIDFTVNYRFDFNRYPTDCGIGINAFNVNNDPLGGINGRCVCEELAVTATNTIANLSFTPSDPTCVEFHVNHLGYLTGGSNPFSIVGKAVTWNSVTGQYDINTTDCVYVCYFTHDGL